MFGYIRPYQPEMKVKDVARFRAYYCGVCQSLKNRYGPFARLALRYDAAFLAVFHDGLSSQKPLLIEKKRCIAHPIRPHMMANPNHLIDRCADMNVLLAWYAGKDRFYDEKRIDGLCVMAMLYRSYRKCKAKNRTSWIGIAKCVHTLQKLEKSGCYQIDHAAEPFSKLMQSFACDERFLKTGVCTSALSSFGYHLGKWLYLIDAYDDIERDVKRSSYNVFIACAKHEGIETTAHKIKAHMAKRARFVLMQCLAHLGQAYERIEFLKNRDIIENIIYVGLLHTTDCVLRGERLDEQSI